MADVIPGVNLGGITSEGVKSSVLAGAKTFMIVFVVVMILLFIGLILYFFWYRNLKFKQYKVQIWRENGNGRPLLRSDQAGIFNNPRTGSKKLYLRYSKIGLEPDKIPFMVGEKGSRTIILYQTGLKDYSYVDPTIENRDLKVKIGTSNVSWAVDAFNEAIAIQGGSWWDKNGTMVMNAFFIMIMVVMTIIFFTQVVPAIKDLTSATGSTAGQLLEIQKIQLNITQAQGEILKAYRPTIING